MTSATEAALAAETEAAVAEAAKPGYGKICGTA